MKKILLPLIALSITSTSAFASQVQHEGRQTKERPISQVIFQHLDTDKDGEISIEQIKTFNDERRIDMSSRYFDHMDADKDGKVSKEEYFDHIEQLKSKMAEKRASKVDTDDVKKPSHHRKHNPEKRFDRLDSDNDGFITKVEYLDSKVKHNKSKSSKKMQNRFDKADIDGNGTLNFEEFDAFSSKNR